MTPERAEERSVYLELNRNESRIIAERMRSMLTFHGFLFTAVGVSASQRLFALALVLAFLGLLVCAPWFFSVLLSYRGIASVNANYRNRKSADEAELDAYRVRNMGQNGWKPTWAGEFLLLPEVFL